MLEQILSSSTEGTLTTFYGNTSNHTALFDDGRNQLVLSIAPVDTDPTDYEVSFAYKAANEGDNDTFQCITVSKESLKNDGVFSISGTTTHHFYTTCRLIGSSRRPTLINVTANIESSSD